MLIYLADLAHTYSTKNESLMVPLNIGFIKAYAKKQHGNNIDIKLFKNPDEFLKTFYKKPPFILGLSNYGWNADLNLKVGKFLKSELLPSLGIFQTWLESVAPSPILYKPSG